MKHIAKTLTMIGCLVAMFSFGSCSKDDSSNTNTSDEVTIIGSWKYSFGSGYVTLTFDQDGYVRYYELDGGEVDGDEYWRYVYEDNILTLIIEGDTENIEVETLSKQKLVLRDWPDSGLCVFIKQ